MQLTLPCNVRSVGKCIILECYRIDKYEVDEDNEHFCTVDGVLYSKDMTKLVAFPPFSPSALQSYDIPDSVATIGDAAFCGCDRLTAVTIPDSVTTIGAEAFRGCIRLADIYIPDSVTAIGKHAFGSCAFTTVTIPDSVIDIEESVFYYCSKLTKVKMPDSLKTIGRWAFANCSSLEEIIIPNHVTGIDDGAFSYCVNLKKIVIPNSVTSLGSEAFNMCQDLENVTLSESLTTIRQGTFSGCTSLSEIVIPGSVTSIDDTAFGYCEELEKVISLNIEPPMCDEFAFTGKSCNFHTLCVPVGSRKAYSVAEGWQEFKNVEEIVFVQTLSESQPLYSDSATLHGHVVSGTEEVLELGFEYWSGRGSVRTVVSEDRNFRANVSNLKDATTYHYRAYARTMCGTVHGKVRTFSTLNLSSLNGPCLDGINEAYTELEEAWEAILIDYPDVGDDFASNYYAISLELQDLESDIEDAYERDKLNDAVTYEIMAKLDDIKQEMEIMLAEAEAAENTYIYREIVREIDIVRIDFIYDIETIKRDCPNVAEQFKSACNHISATLDKMRNAMKTARKRGELTQDKADRIRADLNVIEEEITDLMFDAQEAQKDLSPE